MEGYDIIDPKRNKVLAEFKDDILVVDYGLISKHKIQPNKIVMVLAGSHTYGQLAISNALSDLKFYNKLIEEKINLSEFQVLIKVSIKDIWPNNYEIIEIYPLNHHS